MTEVMTEVCCQFGEGKRLCGIVTQPVSNKHSDTFIILINAGFVSTSGPFRLYTLLTRELQSEGVASLRFDLGGIGFSEPSNNHLTLTERTQLDIRDAVDFVVRQFSAKHILLGGLCSGAEDAFRYAKQDERVDGVVMIDPHCYRTNGYYRRRRWSLELPRRIIAKLLYWFDLLRFSDKESPAIENSNLIDYEYMPREESQSILKYLLTHNKRLHYCYTGGVKESLNSAQQVTEMYSEIDFNGKVTVDYLPHIDHTQILEEDREALLGCLVRRITSWQFDV